MKINLYSSLLLHGKRSAAGVRVLLLAWLGGCPLMGVEPVRAQDAPTYQVPPKPLADLVTVPPTPLVSLSDNGEYLLLEELAAAPSIAELSQPELRLAGLRMNPRNNGPSRVTYITNLKLRRLRAKAAVPVTGLPANPRISYVRWSPDQTKIAFAHTTEEAIELYLLDVPTAGARRVAGIALNATMGEPFAWVPDGKHLVVKTIPAGRPAAPEPNRVPAGPTVQENLGKKAQAPTFQDLLRNPADQAAFAYYTTCQVVRLGLDGSSQPIGEPAMVASAIPSPDGRFVLTETMHPPFSYLVPAEYFPLRTEVFAMAGPLVQTLHDRPLQENVPWGPDAVPAGPRDFRWRNDEPAAVYYAEAQDGGDPKAAAAVRDKVFLREAPFTGEPKEIYTATYRFGDFTWGDASVALAAEYWWQTRRQRTRVVNPADWTATTLFDRSSEDRYSHPGAPDTRLNAYGREVLNLLPGGHVLMLGLGASAQGDRPFVDKLNLKTKKTERLWRSEAPVFERPVEVVNAAKLQVLTTRETPDENPNYFVRTLGQKRNAIAQLTAFPHPYPQLKGVTKQVLRYKRADGVDLSATLYLPAGYKKEQGPLPTFLWAYPTEFKDPGAAGQVIGSPYEFNRINARGAAAFVTMGYAVLDNASIPIVGEGDKEPNDTYVEQLVASAKAAIDEGVRLGVVDAKKVGVGGHSYGAFMTANLLTHSNLFRGGIARSGAYNRTLTPFGFQREERTYWQAPEVYNRMSPFMNADKMKTPLLLIHGEADNNTGTFPIQSERYYSALKGMGATTRLVMLPYESHGYVAKESLLHMLWETNQWLDKYVRSESASAAGK
jgi:dipeptidyl aminopeptidase/acylaminoacyl peptidase